MDNKKLDDYINMLFAVGIEPYMQSLQKHGAVNKKNILDVGCGSGIWTIAVAKLNPKSSVVAIDTNEYLLKFAINYTLKNNINNCEFIKDSYENLLQVYQPGSFDLIMCNSVIQYIDENKAFEVFSHLLKKDGTLIMFYNHGFGYYLWKIFSGIKNLNLGSSIYGIRIIINTLSNRILNTISTDHFETLRYLRKISKKNGIILTQIENEPKLDYQDKYFGTTYVFSCEGIKKNL